MKFLGVHKTVKYASRATGVTSADTYATGVDYDAKRDPTTFGDIAGKERTVATWHLYAIAGQTVLPERLGRIADGTEIWHVLDVRRSYGDLKHDCSCVLEVP